MITHCSRLLPHTNIAIKDDGLVFSFDRRAYARTMSEIATVDLLDELEHARYLAVEYASLPDSRAVAEIQVKALADELARRQRLIATGDDYAPRWPRKRPDVPARIVAVKAAWPVERMVTELLGCQLERAGKDRLKSRCPFHDERTPSFTVFTPEARAWCFGCNQGGDVIELAGLYFGRDRFIDKLESLERFAGIVP